MSTVAFNWLEDESRRDLRRWALAGAVVVAIHLTVISAFLYTHQPEEVGDDSAISIDLVPTGDVVDQPEVQPQPEVEQKPDETPPPPEETQTIVVPPPQEKQSEEQKPAAQAMPARTKGGTQNAVAPTWVSGLFKQLQRAKRYPAAAQSRGEEGVVMLGFTVDRNGHVLAHRILQSSGHPELDTEVSALIERAQPLPPFPPSMPEQQLDLTVPIRFSLR
jgi:protein TonB